MPKISAVIITFNEERNIRRCLSSLKNIADEIVVVDSFSTDKTEEICREYGVKFVRHIFEGHIEQKNYALTECRFDHVLSLDADEALSPALIQMLLEKKKNWDCDFYYMNRLSNYCGKWIRHGGWYPDKKIRLFNRNMVKWGGINPHDKIIPNGHSRIGYLRGDILHYTINSISEHIKQVDYFTDINSRMAFLQGKKSGYFQILFNPAFKFFKGYILQRGFLDGYYGFIISIISSHSKFLKYVKLKELEIKQRGL